MGRNRIDFPFNTAGSNSFTAPQYFYAGLYADPVGSMQFGVDSGPNAGYTGMNISAANGAQIIGGSGTVNDLVIASLELGFIYANVPMNADYFNFPNGITLEEGSLLTTYIQEQAFTPTPNGFTIVNGTGAVTFAGSMTQIGKYQHYEIVATLTGTATLAATLGTSYFIGLPGTGFSPVIANHVIDANGVNYGHGETTAGGQHFSPTIAATHGNGSIVFSCEREVV